MRERVATWPGRRRRSITVGTFHAFCAKVLREHGHGARPAAEVHDLRRLRPAERGQVRHARAARARDDHASFRGAGADVAGQEPHGDAGGLPGRRARGGRDQLVGSVWQRYREFLARTRSLDFDDLLLETVRLLREHDEVRAHYRQRYRYVLVDEYQDTNHPAVRDREADRRRAPQRLRGGRRRPVHLRLARRGHPEDPRLPPRLRGRQDRPPADQLPLDARRSWTRPTRSSARTRPATRRPWSPRAATASPCASRASRTRWRRRSSWCARCATCCALEEAQAAGLRDPLPHPGAVPALRGRAARERAALRGGRAACRSSTARRCATSSPTCKLAVNPRDETSLLRIINTPARGVGKASLDRVLAFATERRHLRGRGLRARAARSTGSRRRRSRATASCARPSTAPACRAPGAQLVSRLERFLETIAYRDEVTRLYPDPMTREARWAGVLEVLNFAENHVRRSSEPSLHGFLEELALTSGDGPGEKTGDAQGRGHADDAPRGQGPGVPARVPGRDGGGHPPARARGGGRARSRRSGASPTSASRAR